MAIENQIIEFDPESWQHYYTQAAVNTGLKTAEGRKTITLDFSGQPEIRYGMSEKGSGSKTENLLPSASGLVPAAYPMVSDISADSGTANQNNPTNGKSTGDYDSLLKAISDIVDKKLSEIKVYVLEADITEAQNSVKSIVEMSSF